MAQELAERRERRFLRITCSAAEQLNGAKVEPVRIPDYIALPLLESATLVDDEGLQEKWASLLANAAMPNPQVTVSEVFPRILASLSPRQARFLDVIFDYSYRRIFIKIKPVQAQTISGHSRLNEQQLNNAIVNSAFRWAGWADPAEKARTIDHLVTQGVLRVEKQIDPASYSVIGATLFEEAGIKKPPRWKSDYAIQMLTFYELTIVGAEFLMACRPIERRP
jgi:phosphoribosylformylglycinamidine (FGAM) synthase PurS component